MNTSTATDTIRAALAESPYHWHGLRVVDATDEAIVGAELGASRVWVDGDVTDEMLPGTSAVDLRVGVGRALRLSAVYEGRYLLGTSIARPLIAKRMIEIIEEGE